MAWTDLLLPMDDCDFFVRLVPFPPGPIHACLVENEDGTCSMYIDSKLPHEKAVDSYWHEYEHLAYDDLHNGRPIDEIEEK